MVELFSHPLVKSYRAPVLSCSFIFCLFLLLISVILPFFLAFSTYEFWKKSEIYFEQAKVLYRREILVSISTESQSISSSSVVSEQSSYFFSSMGYLNEMYGANLTPMTVDSSLFDYNFDNKPDSYEINITGFLPAQSVKNIKVISLFDYSIKDRMKMDLIGMAWVDVNTPAGAGQTFIGGDLMFKQRNLLKTSTVTRTEYNYSLISNSSASENDLGRILMRDSDRNFTTVFDYLSTNVPMNQSFFQVCLKIRIPIYQKFQYEPGFLEVMKFSWIQYLSFLLPVGFLIYSFAKFVFSNQILASQVNYEDTLIKE